MAGYYFSKLMNDTNFLAFRAFGFYQTKLEKCNFFLNFDNLKRINSFFFQLPYLCVILFVMF